MNKVTKKELSYEEATRRLINEVNEIMAKTYGYTFRIERIK